MVGLLFKQMKEESRVLSKTNNYDIKETRKIRLEKNERSVPY